MIELSKCYEYSGKAFVIRSYKELGSYRISVYAKSGTSDYSSSAAFPIAQFEWKDDFYPILTVDNKLAHQTVVFTQELAEKMIAYIIKYDKLTAFK